MYVCMQGVIHAQMDVDIPILDTQSSCAQIQEKKTIINWSTNNYNKCSTAFFLTQSQSASLKTGKIPDGLNAEIALAL